MRAARRLALSAAAATCAPRALALLGGALILIAAAALASCERGVPVISPTARWHPFVDDAHGFAFDVQEPYGPEVKGARSGVWRAGVSRPDDGSGAAQMTITARRLPRGSTLTPGTLIEVAPAMTKEALESRRLAGATDLRLEQPLQPVSILGAPGLEMLYTWTDAETGLVMRSNVVILVNEPWLLAFEITGPAVSWEQGGPTLRRFLDSLRLYEPAGK